MWVQTLIWFKKHNMWTIYRENSPDWYHVKPQLNVTQKLHWYHVNHHWTWKFKLIDIFMFIYIFLPFSIIFFPCQVASSLNSSYSYILNSSSNVFTWSGSLTNSDNQELVERLLDLIKVCIIFSHLAHRVWLLNILDKYVLYELNLVI